MTVTFYATVDADSIRPYMPDVPILLPASSFARKGLRPLRLPAHLTAERAADSGGFVATLTWGDYTYTPAEYVAWLRTWQPTWAATMDYCCEPELGALDVQHRQDRTTEQAWRFWLDYRGEPWAWVPTVQGWTVAQYRAHARDLRPVVRAMQQHYGTASAFRVGIGTLCRRAGVGLIRDVVQAVREELPGVPLHLWGVKLTLLKQGVPPDVVSVDSAAYKGLDQARSLGAWKAHGLTQREYVYKVALPAYRERIRQALETSRTLPLLCQTGVAA